MDPELQVAFETLRQHVDRGFAQVSQRFDQLGQRFEAIDRRFDQVDQRFEAIDQRFEAVDRRFEVTAAETRRHFEVVAEGLRGDVRLVAEGFSRIDTPETLLRGEIARSHDALAGLFRLGYTDLDRRIRVLEGRPPDSA